ncbi:hypothetical protein EYF80_056310 [Liparis tanakae]|uniref:Uncharacterized protein n=1 Tax=Liparis tanakae TaxID=230148 RepID=A0A4Z2EX40_9TELE|nr:hypothetical protein EYF80_056310 [Liparis tanakae]
MAATFLVERAGRARRDEDRSYPTELNKDLLCNRYYTSSTPAPDCLLTASSQGTSGWILLSLD